MSEFWLGSLCISDFKSFVPGSGHPGGGISSTRMVELDMPEELCRCIQHLGDRVLVSVLRGSRESRLILMEESSASHRGGNSARSQSSSSSTWGFIRHTQCRLPVLHVVGGLNPERSARLVKGVVPGVQYCHESVLGREWVTSPRPLCVSRCLEGQMVALTLEDHGDAYRELRVENTCWGVTAMSGCSVGAPLNHCAVVIQIFLTWCLSLHYFNPICVFSTWDASSPVSASYFLTCFF